MTETLPYWRNVYRTVRGQHVNGPAALALIEGMKDEVLTGLDLYKPYTEEGRKEWMHNVNTKNLCLERCIEKISYMLNLDCSIAYGIFCNFLMFEYYGRVNDIVEVMSLENGVENLMKRVWHFYNTDRFFYLKTLRYLIDNRNNVPLCKSFVQKVTEKGLRLAVQRQLRHLHGEIKLENEKFCLTLKDWVDRNNAEQIEVLIIVITILNELDDVQESIEILKLLVEEGIAKWRAHYRVVDLSEASDLRTLANLRQIGFLVMINKKWTDPKWFEKYKEFRKIIDEIPNFEEANSFMLLVWCVYTIINFSKIQDREYTTAIQDKFSECFNMKAISIVYEVLELPFVKVNTEFGVIIKNAVFNLLEQFCSKVTNIFFLYMMKGIMDVLAKVMQVRDLCRRVVDTSCPVNKMFALALNMYPLDVDSFTNVCEVLLEHGEFDAQVVDVMKNIQVLTQENVKSLSMNTLIVDFDQYPIPTLKLPAGCVCTTLDYYPYRSVVQFKGNFSYSYYHYLEFFLKTSVHFVEHNTVLNEEQQKIVDYALVSMKLTGKVLLRDRQLCYNQFLLSALAQCQFLMSKNVNLKCVHSKLLSAAFDFCIAMLPNEYERENILSTLTSRRCLPPIGRDLLESELLLRVNVTDESPLMQAMCVDVTHGKYTLLLTYCDYLLKNLEGIPEYPQFLVRGAIFIFHHVFPYHLQWQYTNVFERNKLTKLMLRYIHTLLQIDNNKDQIPEVKATYRLCLYSFSHNETFLRVYFAVLRMNNNSIEKMMNTEHEWDKGCTGEITFMLRLCLSIALQVINLLGQDEIKKCAFWNVMCGTTNVNTIKIIANYINFKYDLAIPKLACKLIKQIAKDSKLSVLSCLEIDYYQAQCMFLERLHDPFEEEEIKVSLLELITTCLLYQTGLTSALFNIVLKENKQQIVETVSVFLNDYIENYHYKKVNYPLQFAVLELLHTIWMENKFVLISDVTDKPKFWPTITNPLILDFTMKPEVYHMILDILAAEIAANRISPTLVKILTDLFTKDSKFVLNFTSYLLQSLHSDPHNIEYTKMLVSWKAFVIYCVKNQDVSDDTTKQLLVSSTLTSLTTYLQIDPRHNTIVRAWSELYLYLITKWGTKSYKPDCDWVEVSLFFQSVENIYPYLQRRTRETIITMAVRFIENFGVAFEGKSDTIERFLKAMDCIMVFEYDNAQKLIEDKKTSERKHFSWMLMVLFASKITKHKLYHKWVFHTQIFTKVFETIPHFMNDLDTLDLATVALNFLCEYANSENGNEYYFVDFRKFYFSLNFPRELFEWHTRKTDVNGTTLQNFWLAYATLVQLNLVLIDKFTHHMLLPLFEFLSFQAEEFIALMQLPRHTANPAALKLVELCIKMVGKVFKWAKTVGHKQEHIIRAYAGRVIECFRTSARILVCPRLMEFYKDDKKFCAHEVETISIKCVVKIMNSLINIIITSCFALLELSPKMMKPLSLNKGYNDFQRTLRYPIVEHSVTPEEIQGMSFGTLVSVTQYLCKILLQILSQKHDLRDAHISTRTFQIVPKRSAVETSSTCDIPYMVLVHFNRIGLHMVERLNSTQRLSGSEIHSLSIPWLSLIDKGIVMGALEIVNTLMATQLIKAIVTAQNNAQLQFLRRDLCSELQPFHEFVRKRLISSQKYIMEGNNVFMNKSYIERSKDSSAQSSDFMLMLSHWFIVFGQLTP